MADPIRYGLDNPHPLSQMKTELIWAGKYDATGRKVAPVRVKLPFQTVETVNESVQQRQFALDLFSTGRSAEWRNRLIWGDKKYVLPALLDEFAGQVDLVYIDPPFNVGANFAFQVSIEDELFTSRFADFSVDSKIPIRNLTEHLQLDSAAMQDITR